MKACAIEGNSWFRLLAVTKERKAHCTGRACLGPLFGGTKALH